MLTMLKIYNDNKCFSSRVTPKASNFLSLVQHVVIVSIGLYKLDGLPFGWFNSLKPAIAIRHYIPLMLLSLIAALVGNIETLDSRAQKNIPFS